MLTASSGCGEARGRLTHNEVVRVLVVEDDDVFRDALANGLVAEGFAVDEAATGDDGLRLASTGAYSAVVLDLMLPGLSGFYVCRAVRAAGLNTPILVLSAKDGVWDQVDALDEGADDYVVKPFTFPILAARLRAVIRRGSLGGHRSSTIEVGDLTLDLRRRECLRCDELITLTNLEFAVLEALAIRPGEVCSKADLLMDVWQGDGEDENLVEAVVSRLRRKIDAPFGRETLRTVRGFGYRLVDDR